MTLFCVPGLVLCSPCIGDVSTCGGACKDGSNKDERFVRSASSNAFARGVVSFESILQLFSDISPSGASKSPTGAWGRRSGLDLRWGLRLAGDEEIIPELFSKYEGGCMPRRSPRSAGYRL